MSWLGSVLAAVAVLVAEDVGLGPLGASVAVGVRDVGNAEGLEDGCPDEQAPISTQVAAKRAVGHRRIVVTNCRRHRRRSRPR